MAVDLEYEQQWGPLVMGIDEAGRGPLAGGVYAAAVSLPLDLAAELLATTWSGINDSKKLSEKKREALAEIIQSTPGCIYAIASASPAEIDQLNILRATHLAMKRAAEAVGERIDGLLRRFTPRNDGDEKSRNDDLAPVDRKPHILVDGNPVKTLPYPSTNIIKGDAKSLLIAAASILAKTARDADCLRLDACYPGYGFAQHKGYPTPAHLAALRKLGPCPEHRRSFAPVAQPELGL